MTSSFGGFSEEDLQRMKSRETGSNSAAQTLVQQNSTTVVKKIDKIGAVPKRPTNQYKLPALLTQYSDDNFDSLFDKCKLSIKTPTSPPEDNFNNNSMKTDSNEYFESTDDEEEIKDINFDNSSADTSRKSSIVTVESRKNSAVEVESRKNSTVDVGSRKNSSVVAPDLVRSVDNYTEGDAAHKEKLEGLQLRQKLMEEQNKKRKEMLSKALAERTKQTEEEVLKLEKIKREVQVLDGQFSLDVAVLRKKIDQACLTYAEAEKHYLRIEKDFLQAKINLQKEKEKKELLSEHLCALITHNETRKAQKLETLMLELASDMKVEIGDVPTTDDDDKPVVVDGVDERTGKMVEFTES